MRLVPLSKGYFAKVSDKDYARVMAAGTWYAVVRKHKVYAQRTVRDKEGKHALLLHRFIMRVFVYSEQVDH
jgi:hypothetical protein